MVAVSCPELISAITDWKKEFINAKVNSINILLKKKKKKKKKKGNFKKIATVYKMILKNSHSFKKFKN